jgi:hypothetical protein
VEKAKSMFVRSPNPYLAELCMYLTLITTVLQIVIMGLEDTGVAPLEKCVWIHPRGFHLVNEPVSERDGEP